MTAAAIHRSPRPDAVTGVVFERFPFGLLVTDGDGMILAANDAARSLLETPSERELDGDWCCRLLGCRRDGAPLGGECLSALALATGQTLPDVRLDLPTGPSRALWVTSAPLTDTTALLELRPADARDRRRRTEPHWLNGPALRIRTLGRTAVSSAEGPIDGAWLGQLPGQLLKYLVCERGRVAHADELIEHFWPDVGRGAVANLRHTVFALRKRLEPGRERHSASSFILAREGGYLLDPRLISVDADAFEASAELGLAAHGGGGDAAREPLEQAAALYAGAFLADEPFAEWAFAERDRLHGVACRVLAALTDARMAAGEPEAALEGLTRLADLEPFDGSVQRRLLALLVELDHRSEAVRRYRQLHARWVDAFGQPPGFDIRSL